MSGTTLTLERDPSGIAVLRLSPIPAGSPVVVLNREMLGAIDAALDELKASPARGFILASDSKVFIAGADLKEIMALTDPELHDYLRFGQRVYGRIAALPCTTVAAINGATLGGGLEIAMHCDHLIAALPFSPAPGGGDVAQRQRGNPQTPPDKPARPYPIGLPEAGLSICPGWGGTNMLPARMDPGRAIRMTATGQTFTINDAAEAGLVELMVSPDDLLARAKTLAARPKRVARARPRCIEDADRREAVAAALAHVTPELPASQAARAVADCVRIGLEKGWLAALDAEREHLVRLRNTPEGRSAIETFFAKSEKK